MVWTRVGSVDSVPDPGLVDASDMRIRMHEAEQWVLSCGHSHIPAAHPTPLFPKGALLSSRHVGDMSRVGPTSRGPARPSVTTCLQVHGFPGSQAVLCPHTHDTDTRLKDGAPVGVPAAVVVPPGHRVPTG